MITPDRENQANQLLRVLYDIFAEAGDSRQYIIKDLLEQVENEFHMPKIPVVYAALHAIRASQEHPISYPIAYNGLSVPFVHSTTTPNNVLNTNIDFIVREINHPSLSYTWSAEREGRYLLCEYCQQPMNYFSRLHGNLAEEWLMRNENNHDEFCPACYRRMQKMKMSP